jgi:curved DNA-binding protein CbpA
LSVRKKYYDLFGLDESAGKTEIRRAYRKLAMKYHPDKNQDPRAHQIFVDLAEAYEILINDRLPKGNELKTRKEKSFEERRKDAEERFRKQQERQRREQEAYFANLTKGKKWLVFKRFAQISAFLSCLLLLDTLLPTHMENHTIISYSPKYNGIINGQVISFKTDRELEIFVKNPYPNMYTSQPQIGVERSWIFHNPVKVWHRTRYYLKSFDVDFSVTSLFPSVPMLFLLPILTMYYRRKSFWFTLFYLFSFNIIGIFVVYFLVTQDRWLHLLTLGII